MRGRTRHSIIAAVMVVLYFSTAARLSAQALYGSIVGTVTDATGGVVPGAAVKVTQTGTGQVRQTLTNETGAYSFPTLSTGTYTVSVSREGFSGFTRQGVTVTIDSVVRVDVALNVGSTAESVSVTAQTATLQTDKAEVRSEISSKEVQELPVPTNRNYQNLLVMVPGVSPPSSSSSLAANPARGEVFSVNGATQGASNTRIEGANAINAWMSHETGYVPGLEAIETVTVTTSSLDADQGLAGSAAINVQLKSGTNALHGSGFEYNQNNAMKSNPFFLPAGQRKPKFIDNQLGGTLGGPIIKNKLFYFGSYDGQFVRQNASQIVTVPTAAIRDGDMSGSSTPIYDPSTGNSDGSGRTAFPGNRIPTARLDPIALKIQQLYPLPNLGSGIATNYYATGSYKVNRHKFDGKLNWNPTRKLTMTARLGALDYNAFNPDMFGDNGNPVNSSATRDGTMSGTVFNGTVSGTYTVSARVIVDSYFGYTRLDNSQEPVSLSKGNLGVTLFNLPGTNGPTRGYGGYPSFSITSYAAFGKYADSPVYYYDPAYDYVANASWVKGNHNIRFGIDIQRIENNNWELGTNGGSFSFGGGPTTLKGGPSANQFNNYSTFLLGLTTGATNTFLQGDYATSRMWADSLYVRDQWQVSRALTLSLGLRWEYLPFGTGANRGFETYDFQTNTMYLCGIGQTPRDCGVKVPKKDFSPRVGLAWRTTPTLVVRAGFGINFDPNPLAWVRDFVGEAETQVSPSWPGPPNSFLPTSLLSQGVPAPVFPDVSSGAIPNYPLTQAFTVPPPVYHMPYIESWNFTVEKQLPKGLLAQAGYVGDRQIKQLQVVNVNAGALPGAGTLGEPLYLKFGRTGSSGLIENYGRNSYDSLQTKLVKSYSNGLAMQVVYTFSKALALCCDALSDKNPA
ncbi:MAG TPA: TonB-dependent receptor, partial [Bryobacteraceae bacterium]